jgi:acyl-CoA synthetase (AMP-forming)/AMP-acid ligase II
VLQPRLEWKYVTATFNCTVCMAYFFLLSFFPFFLHSFKKTFFFFFLMSHDKKRKVEAATRKRLKCLVKQGWGMSELSPLGCLNPDDDIRRYGKKRRKKKKLYFFQCLKVLLLILSSFIIFIILKYAVMSVITPTHTHTPTIMDALIMFIYKQWIKWTSSCFDAFQDC